MSEDELVKEAYKVATDFIGRGTVGDELADTIVHIAKKYAETYASGGER